MKAWLSVLASRNAVLVYALIAIGIVFQIFTADATNSFLSAASLATVLRQAAVIGVLACGMTFIIILGHIDLSVGSAVAFLGALAAMAMAEPAVTDAVTATGGWGWSPWVVIPGIMLLAAALWAAKGVLQEWTGMPAFIITLGGMMGYRGLAYLVAEREIPLSYDHPLLLVDSTAPLWLGWLIVAAGVLLAAWETWQARRRDESGWSATALPYLLIAAIVIFLQMQHDGVLESRRGVSWLTVLWAITASVCAALATRTVFGKHVMATGGNREAARLCGIPVARINILVFLLMGLCTGLASLMYLGQQGTAESGAGNLLELDAIAACVLGGVSLMGGRGSIAGAVLGALIMQSLSSGLQQCQVATGYQMVIKATVLVGVVAGDHLLRRRS